MVKELPVIYLQTGGCSGCAVSMLNTASPTIKNALIDQIVPGMHINLRFHPTVMAAAGDLAVRVLESTAEEKKGEYVLVVDGAAPGSDGAMYGAIGERNGRPVPMADRVEELAKDALAIIAMGTCASFGGIPAAAPNPTSCQPVKKILDAKDFNKLMVNPELLSKSVFALEQKE